MKLLKICLFMGLAMLILGATYQVNNEPPKKYVIVTVAPHDTVWNICERVQRETNQLVDIREIVYFTEKANNLSPNQPIHAGDKLKVAIVQ